MDGIKFSAAGSLPATSPDDFNVPWVDAIFKDSCKLQLPSAVLYLIDDTELHHIFDKYESNDESAPGIEDVSSDMDLEDEEETIFPNIFELSSSLSAENLTRM